MESMINNVITNQYIVLCAKKNKQQILYNAFILVGVVEAASSSLVTQTK